MIEQVIEKWHANMRGQLPGGLDELLADDVVFYSPIVYTPQEGKAITKLYLQAAGQEPEAFVQDVRDGAARAVAGDDAVVGEFPGTHIDGAVTLAAERTYFDTAVGIERETAGG